MCVCVHIRDGSFVRSLIATFACCACQHTFEKPSAHIQAPHRCCLLFFSMIVAELGLIGFATVSEELLVSSVIGLQRVYGSKLPWIGLDCIRRELHDTGIKRLVYLLGSVIQLSGFFYSLLLKDHRDHGVSADMSPCEKYQNKHRIKSENNIRVGSAKWVVGPIGQGF